MSVDALAMLACSVVAFTVSAVVAAALVLKRDGVGRLAAVVVSSLVGTSAGVLTAICIEHTLTLAIDVLTPAPVVLAVSECPDADVTP